MKTLAPFSSNQRMNGFRLLIGLLILFISINWPLSSIAQDYNGKKFYVAGRVFDKYTEKRHTSRQTQTDVNDRQHGGA